MAIKLSAAVRNARLDAIETTIGAGAKLQIRSGAAPANCAAAHTGTLLAELTLPADWMNDASAGGKTLLGAWAENAVGDGTAGHFRIVDAATSLVTGLQGTVGATSSGEDMELDNVVIANGQAVTITTFTLTDANA